MKRFLRMITLGALAALCSVQGACTRAWGESPSAKSGDPFIVHEWGTFTSFQGAGGVSVDGMQHETEALPAFVHSRLDPRTSPLAALGDASRDVPVRHCHGKMETPVIYFHSRTARHAKVHVDFGGLLSQWYPAASHATPAFTGGEQHDLGAVDHSSLDWDVDLVPRTAGAPSMPIVDANSDWQKAREVDAAYVRAAGSAEADQYVFYRGLMRAVTQPIVQPMTNDAVSMINGSPNVIGTAFFLDMKATTARFTIAREVGTGARGLSLAALPERPKSEVVADVARAVQSALVAQGLYADEARAMVRTWSETWFSAEGTRVLYLVPRPVTDAALPLAIAPTPDELTRVMVGRIELLMPAREIAIADDLRNVQSPEASVRDAALARVAKLGRFVEPAMRSIAQRTEDPVARAGTATVLARLAVAP